MATTDPERAAAIQRIKARRGFLSHLAVWAAFSVVFVLIWLATGHSYFWPMWIIVPWGIVVALHGWTVFGQRPISEAEISREIRKGDGRPPG
jgi:hypothetical protein